MRVNDTLTIPPGIDATLHDKAEELEREQRRLKARMVREGRVVLEQHGRWPRTRPWWSRAT
jgi:hypothetical protein